MHSRPHSSATQSGIMPTVPSDLPMLEEQKDEASYVTFLKKQVQELQAKLKQERMLVDKRKHQHHRFMEF